MTIPEILAELEPYNGRFPRTAMAAAIEQREAITPELLRVVEAVAADPVKHAEDQHHMLHVYALYLLAQFRETRAYEPIAKMCGAPGETPDDLIGDTIAGGLNRIFASVYNGDPAPLQRLVESDESDDFVRGAALDAFVVLAHTNQMSRDEVAGYFRGLFREKLTRIPSHIWNVLVCAVADLPAPELLAEVRLAYADDLADPGFADLAGIEQDLIPELPGLRKQFTVITDAIAEMDWWAAFDPNARWTGDDLLAPEILPDELEPPWLPPAGHIPPEPAQPVRREPKIGRNEPCPCGSGKKYKKCCGQG